MFPREPQGEVYPDLYEETASRNYTIESVFGVKAGTASRGAGVEPAQRTQPSFQANRSPSRKRPEPNFTVERKKTRTFTRPGEEPKKLPSTDPNSLFKTPRF